MAWLVIFAERSIRDLEKIVDYIKRDNPTAAERFGLLLVEQAESLAEAPYLGPVLPLNSNLRYFPVGWYVIIYRLDAKKEVVRVLRFWHSARAKRPTR